MQNNLVLAKFLFGMPVHCKLQCIEAILLLLEQILCSFYSVVHNSQNNGVLNL